MVPDFHWTDNARELLLNFAINVRLIIPLSDTVSLTMEESPHHVQIAMHKIYFLESMMGNIYYIGPTYMYMHGLTSHPFFYNTWFTSYRYLYIYFFIHVLNDIVWFQNSIVLCMHVVKWVIYYMVRPG